ncbi:unnamed protein product, partial [Scytosiphon promiscuus]
LDPLHSRERGLSTTAEEDAPGPHHSSFRLQSPFRTTTAAHVPSCTSQNPATTLKGNIKSLGVARGKSVGSASTAPAVAATAESGTASLSMLPPPSPHKAGQQHREHRRRAPLSRLQQSAGESGGAHDVAAVAAVSPSPTFQSPSKHRFSLPHAPPS